MSRTKFYLLHIILQGIVGGIALPPWTSYFQNSSILQSGFAVFLQHLFSAVRHDSVCLVFILLLFHPKKTQGSTTPPGGTFLRTWSVQFRSCHFYPILVGFFCFADVFLFGTHTLVFIQKSLQRSGVFAKCSSTEWLFTTAKYIISSAAPWHPFICPLALYHLNYTWMIKWFLLFPSPRIGALGNFSFFLVMSETATFRILLFTSRDTRHIPVCVSTFYSLYLGGSSLHIVGSCPSVFSTCWHDQPFPSGRLIGQWLVTYSIIWQVPSGRRDHSYISSENLFRRSS